MLFALCSPCMSQNSSVQFSPLAPRWCSCFGEVLGSLLHRSCWTHPEIKWLGCVLASTHSTLAGKQHWQGFARAVLEGILINCFVYTLEFNKGSYFKAISMKVPQRGRRNNPLKPTSIKMWKSSGKFWMISIKGDPWETKSSVVQWLFWGKLAWLFHYKLLLFQKFCPLSHGKSLQVYPCSGSQRENRTFQTKQWVWLFFKAE